jgi:adenine-specific DNA-methyltransferase
MGSVAESLQDQIPVVTNDALSFTAAISRARFTNTYSAPDAASVLNRLRPLYLEKVADLSSRFDIQLREEKAALSGCQEALATYMLHARHVGNDPVRASAARDAAGETSDLRYCLATLYFSAGYFSLRQAIAIDALRCAIDTEGRPEETDWLLGSWLVGLSALTNAPGHTAQFLKPNSWAGYKRILRTWNRSVWSQFESAMKLVRPVGSASWRGQNEAFVCDAIELVDSDRLSSVGAFYADPPYTKDQYSRYYHVYETLYRYDFPDSKGAGRIRSDRFSTKFCLKSSVVAAFHDLCRGVASRRAPLVISYPDQGLLDNAGWTLQDIASSYFYDVRKRSIDALHSTMGASKGSPQIRTTENLYVCQP